MNDDAPSASIEVPTFDELMWPALQALKSMGGSATNEKLLAKVIELEGYSPEVQAFQHTDNRQTKLNYNLAWAKTYLKRFGAIENSTRGVWSMTKDGEQMTAADVLSVPGRVRKQVTEEKRAREIARAEEGPTDIEAEDVEATEPYWKDQLLNVLRGIPAAAFERLAQRLLREAGFLKVEVTGKSGDGGIDGIGVLRVNRKRRVADLLACSDALTPIS